MFCCISSAEVVVMAPGLHASIAGQSLQSVEEQSDHSEQPKDSQTASEYASLF